MLKPPLKAVSDGVIQLNPDSADIGGPNLREAAEANPVDCLGDWFAIEDSASWKFIAAPGDYDVQLGFAAAGECNGATYAMTVNGATLSGTINDSGGWFNWAQQDVGRIHLGGGNQTLSIKATSMPRNRIMNLQTITLTPVKQD